MNSTQLWPYKNAKLQDFEIIKDLPVIGYIECDRFTHQEYCLIGNFVKNYFTSIGWNAEMNIFALAHIFSDMLKWECCNRKINIFDTCMTITTTLVNLDDYFKLKHDSVSRSKFDSHKFAI